MKVRVVMPDLWRDGRMEFDPETRVSEIKARALPELLRKWDLDPSDYYVEYFEKEVLDESRTLADLGVPEGGMLSIRPFDLDHPPPFRG
jgi:hypothetical protein